MVVLGSITINAGSIITFIVIISCFLCIIGLTYATIKRNGNGFIIMSISVLILFITCMIEKNVIGETTLGNGVIEIMK
jgi:hypothetical protein